MIAKWTARPLVVALIVCSTALAAHGATIVVTASVTRDGAPAADAVVTLREAILSINAGADLNADVTANRTGTYGTSDTINFAFNGGGVIPLAAAQGTLTVTRTVAIQGYTETTFLVAGVGPNSAVTGDNSTHTVLISGGAVGFAGDCLAISGQTANGTVVRGVVFDSCPASGLSITNSQNNVIAGDFFGTDSAGNFAASAANGTGVSIVAGAGQNISGNQLGGPNPADRNTISGNTTRNFQIFNSGGTASNIIVQHNYVGLNAAGIPTVTGNGQGYMISDL